MEFRGRPKTTPMRKVNSHRDPPQPTHSTAEAKTRQVPPTSRYLATMNSISTDDPLDFRLAGVPAIWRRPSEGWNWVWRSSGTGQISGEIHFIDTTVNNVYSVNSIHSKVCFENARGLSRNFRNSRNGRSQAFRSCQLAHEIRRLSGTPCNAKVRPSIQPESSAKMAREKERPYGENYFDHQS